MSFDSHARYSAVSLGYRNETGGHVGGSYPFPPNGLQRTILQAVSVKPLTAPNFLNDVMPYSEHVGRKRQAGCIRGDISRL